jgi:predicted small lipoprotein YifL
MRKIFHYAVAAAFVFALSSCGQKVTPAPNPPAVPQAVTAPAVRETAVPVPIVPAELTGSLPELTGSLSALPERVATGAVSE